MEETADLFAEQVQQGNHLKVRSAVGSSAAAGDIEPPSERLNGATPVTNLDGFEVLLCKLQHRARNKRVSDSLRALVGETVAQDNQSLTSLQFFMWLTSWLQ